MVTQKGNITALYCRISKDDEVNSGDSNSIVHQKEMLSKFAKERGFMNPRFFVDDGVSGATFNRPGFQEMLGLIEAGEVSTCIVKDMSRFGRNYLQVGVFTEMTFPQHGVRFIAINDGVDSDNGTDNDLTPFRNVFNEWFCRDTSRKIRAVFKARAISGKPGNLNPYGYKKAPSDMYTWLIDENAAEIVREAFQLFLSGKGTNVIAREFRTKQYTTPHFYRLNGDKFDSLNCNWTGSTIARILDNVEYTGTLVTHRLTTPSYKNKKVIVRPKEEWCITENKHEPIVDKETFEAVQKLRSNKRKTNKMGEINSSINELVHCATCGAKEHVKRARAHKYQYFSCGTYYKTVSLGVERRKCTPHSIRKEHLEELVVTELREAFDFAKNRRDEFVKKVQVTTTKAAERSLKSKTAELTKSNDRINFLEKTIRKTYESHVEGVLTIETFTGMLAGYESELATLRARVEVLNAEIENSRDQATKVGRFLKIVDRYVTIEELTPEIATTFIDKILIHETELAPSVKNPGRMSRGGQKIQIFYSFIGEIPKEE